MLYSEVAGSNPALVNMSLFIQNVSKIVPSQFPLCGLLYGTLCSVRSEYNIQCDITLMICKGHVTWSKTFTVSIMEPI